MAQVPAGVPGHSSLAERIRSGDPSAEDEFARYFTGRIRAMLAARTRDPAAAADLAQDTLLAALRALRQGQLRDADRLGAFVYGVARNVLNSHLRGLRDRPREEPIERAPEKANPVEHFEDLERTDRVSRALQDLDEPDRRILALIFGEGLKADEVASRMGLSAEAVRQRKSRALKRVFDQARALSRTRAGSPPSGEAAG